jgi:hypothetical protein
MFSKLGNGDAMLCLVYMIFFSHVMLIILLVPLSVRLFCA